MGTATRMMKRTNAAWLAAVAAYLALAGCAGPNRPAWASLDPDDWANRSTSDEPAQFDVMGPLAIDVENFNGDVTIEADPKHARATIRVQRAAVHGYGRSKEGKASLADVTWSANIVPGELGQLLQVRASSTNSEPHFQRAHVFITAPEIEGIRVVTANGGVRVEDASGLVDITTTNGQVRVMTNRAMTQPVTIVTSNDDIHYRVRGESTAAIDAQTVRGEVTALVKYGTLKVAGQTSDEALLATLNQGTNPVMLRTVDGDIRIAVVSNPTQVSAWIVP